MVQFVKSYNCMLMQTSSWSLHSVVLYLLISSGLDHHSITKIPSKDAPFLALESLIHWIWKLNFLTLLWWNFHISINIELSKFVSKMSHKHAHQKPVNVMCDKLLMRGTLYLTLLLIVLSKIVIYVFCLYFASFQYKKP